jgi:hypothetical protein
MRGGRRFALLVGSVTVAVAASESGFAFRHPGLLHSDEDIARWQRAVAAHEEPIVSGYAQLRRHPRSAPGQKLRGPAEEIGRGPSVFFAEFDHDAATAYQSALLWCVTRDRAYAAQAIAVLNAWSSTLQRVSGADAPLMAALGPFKMINAAELLRHTQAGWHEADIARFERMLRVAILPAVRDFALYANGNWGTACLKTLMAIGVFTDDRALFDRAVRFYHSGAGNGRLTHYVIAATGQAQESGRDQPHVLLGLGHLAEGSEIAWQQGLDLFRLADHRLLAGFEYSARAFLGEPVPFTPWLDRTGKYRHVALSDSGRGRYRPVYEHVWNHYAHRVGIPAPFSEKLAQQHRPEGAMDNADHPGFGTFLFSRPQGTHPAFDLRAAPAGLVADGRSPEIALSWAPVIGADHYVVKRTAHDANATGEPMPIAYSVDAPHFTDHTARPGQLYRYAVAGAVNRPAGGVTRSSDSLPVTVFAGPPPAWSSDALGSVAHVGGATFDGQSITIEAAGSALGRSADEGQLVHTALAGNGRIVARYVPQVSSQFSQFGVALREGSAAESAHVALLVSPLRTSSGHTERPVWQISLVSRPGVTNVAPLPLPESLAPWGRLTRPIWLRLERRAEFVDAAFSVDGTTWTHVGEIPASFSHTVRAGLVVCSGVATLTTTVAFDHVSVSLP